MTDEARPKTGEKAEEKVSSESGESIRDGNSNLSAGETVNFKRSSPSRPHLRDATLDRRVYAATRLHSSIELADYTHSWSLVWVLLLWTALLGITTDCIYHLKRAWCAGGILGGDMAVIALTWRLR